MSNYKTLIKNLTTLNYIVQILNETVDIHQALDTALVRLVDLMGLKTGWIFLKDSASQNRWAGKGYNLVAYYNLPPAMSPGKARPWKGGCDCQALCNKDQLNGAYNEVLCSRLLNSNGDRQNLVVHASAPLRSGNKILGILNVAGENWGVFSEQALVLLTTIGSQMGIALERTRLFELLKEQRIHEQSALLDLSKQLLAHTTLDSLMNYVAREIRSVLKADACAILLPDEDDETLCFQAASGWKVNPVNAGYKLSDNDDHNTDLVMNIEQPLLLEDLQHSARSIRFPQWLLDEGFRSHTVVPLIAESRSVGALFLNTRQPYLLDEDELRFLHLMANYAAIAIEKARLHHEEIKRQRLEEELAVASQIQQTLLPESVPDMPGWEFASIYQPARLVGGDFYDFFDVAGNNKSLLGMVIADVTDKGVPAALFMALSRSIIRTKAMSGPKPTVVLSRANRLILKDSRSNLFLTAVYAILNPETGHLIYCNAGHTYPLWIHADTNEVEELITEGIVLGAFEHVKLENRELTIAPNDALIFFTDGITEAMDSEHNLFGDERLKAVLAANTNRSAKDILQAIIEAVNAFTGDTPQSDDFTIFVVKRLT